jgi:hypothetical protein
LVVSTQQRDLFTGLIRTHVLIHATQEPIFGLAMMEELEHHGYRIGPGTLHPLLHGMERGGLLKSELKNLTGRRRRIYRITFATLSEKISVIRSSTCDSRSRSEPGWVRINLEGRSAV